jgi:hypothetical protein
MGTKSNIKRLYTKESNIVSRKISDEVILVPIKQKARDVDSIYTINEVGSRIWEFIDGKRRIDEIRDLVVKEFEVSTQEAEKDIVEFLKQLEQVGAIKAI